jgi:hypothetical protein
LRVAAALVSFPAGLLAEARLGTTPIANAALARDMAAINRRGRAKLEVRLLDSMYLPVS